MKCEVQRFRLARYDHGGGKLVKMLSAINEAKVEY